MMVVSRRDALRMATGSLLVGLAGCPGSDGSGLGRSPGDRGAGADTGTSDGSDGSGTGLGLTGSGGGWPLPNYDSRNTSAATGRDGPGEGLAAPERWRYPAPEKFETTALTYGPPTVADGLVVVNVTGSLLDHDGDSKRVNAVVALEAGSWTVAWQRDLQSDFGTPVPLVVADGLVLHPDLGGVVARSLEDGSVDWRNESISVPLGPPTVAGETLVVPGTALHALVLGDETERWTRPGGDVKHTPAVADGTVYVTEGPGVVARAMADGTERWRRTHDAFTSYLTNPESPGPLGPPVVADDHILAAAGMDAFAAGDLGGMVALGRADGAVRWTFDVASVLGAPDISRTPSEQGARVGPLPGVYGAPAIADGTAYVNARDSEAGSVLLAVDVASGAVDWQAATAAIGFRVLAGAATVAVVSGEAVEVFDRRSGERLGGASPDAGSQAVIQHAALAGDTVVTGGNHGLLAYRS